MNVVAVQGKRKTLIKLCFIGISVSLAPLALAICPLCIAAASAGAGISEYLRIDDLITGMWTGALWYASMSVVFKQWLTGSKAKRLSFYTALILSLSGFYIILKHYNLINYQLSQLWGLSRFGIGLVCGCLWLAISETSYNSIKQRNHGHPWFPFQKVVMALLPLIVASIVIYAS